MITRMAIIAIIALAPSLADAQSLVPHYGPDGRVYWRRAPMQVQPPPPVTRQQYIPPDIVAPEIPRGMPRQRSFAPSIDIVPLDPLPPEPTPTAPAPAPMAPVEPDPLLEWCKQEANAKAPLCRNVGSPRVQR
jgi:hypothetical protein